MRDVEERAAQVLAAAPSYVWDGERLPVPIEDIVDSVYGLLVRDVEDMSAAPGAPALADGQALSGLLLPTRGEIWVNAEEARLWPPRRRFTIGHELGHWVMHRDGQQALFCRRTSVDEQAAPPGRDIEEEARSPPDCSCPSGCSCASTHVVAATSPSLDARSARRRPRPSVGFWRCSATESACNPVTAGH